ncbi:CDP-alcohol phosphatidyltransferase family protein [Sulfurospirillum sp. 1307]
MIDTYARGYFSKLFLAIAKLLLSLHVKPLHVTVFSLFIGVVGAIYFYVGLHITSLILLWLSGFMDVLDGELARLSNQSSQKGALLDIFFDRIVEISYIFAFIGTASSESLLVLSCTIILSMTLFLSVGAMSQKESKKAFYYQAGLIERTEGFILFSLMIMFADFSTYIAYLFAFLILLTVGQRLKEALSILK